jgi:hypothetical protein
MAAIAAAPSSKTIAGPVTRLWRPGSRTPSLRIALSGASEPCSTTIAGLSENGRSSGRMTSSSRTTALARLSASVAPLTVIALVSSTGSSCLSSACAPPASSNCSIECAPLGRTALRAGTSSPISLKSP